MQKKLFLLGAVIMAALFVGQYFGLTTQDFMQSILTSVVTAITVSVVFIYVLKMKGS